MKILFIGGTKRGYLTLEKIVARYGNNVAVLCLQQDEHEKERYEEPIRVLAEQNDLPYMETKWIKNEKILEFIKSEVKPNISIVVGCRVIIPKEMYTIPRLGTIAVHDSLLPKYRGFAPLNWAIINGEQETGVTLFYLSDGMDEGDVIESRAIPIGDHDTAPMVYEKICQSTIEVVMDCLPKIEEGTAPRIPQQNEDSSYTCKRLPVDGAIDWAQSIKVIYNKVRALAYPYPGAYTYFKNRPLYLHEARPVENQKNYVGNISGRIVNVSKEDGYVDVLTNDGALRIFKVKYESEVQNAVEVIGSINVQLGLDVAKILEITEKVKKDSFDSTSPSFT